MRSEKSLQSVSGLGGITVGAALLMAVQPVSYAEENKTVFNNNCRTCHSINEGDNRLGPNLHQIIGRKSGSADGYNYSSAMKRANLTWDETTLDKFIANPDAVVPGHNMKPYPGIDDTAQRQAILAYLAEEK
ncbi:MAG: c-type cytochrome [Hyphomicrobiaceae bacterium]|nr:c-type cytochrome [Hyphomicrobiaceae bacterium]MCC0010201.1 c-type cytochrome [Hyphomicrobiaceae bacterium]